MEITLTKENIKANLLSKDIIQQVVNIDTYRKKLFLIDKSKYDECYLGQINYYDTDKRAALIHVSYLTKVDESIIAVQLNDKARIFGKMTLPKHASAAGRPRQR